MGENERGIDIQEVKTIEKDVARTRSQVSLINLVALLLFPRKVVPNTVGLWIEDGFKSDKISELVELKEFDDLTRAKD